MDATNKLSFTEIVDKFTKKFGVDFCSSKLQPEFVVEIFIDYLKSMSEDQFNYEKIRELC